MCYAEIFYAVSFQLLAYGEINFFLLSKKLNYLFFFLFPCNLRSLLGSAYQL